MESLPPERDEWGELALQADNVFLTPEWIETWWRHLAEGRPECLTCRGPDGRLLAVAALSVTRLWGLRVARLAGHGPGDQLGVACRPGDRTRVAGALRAALLDDGIDLFVGDGLPEQEGWRGRLDATLLDRDASPAVRLRDDGWEELLARKSWNFRRQVRKRERALLRDHSVRYLLTEEPGRLEADMELLMRLHDARWEGASRAFAGPRRAFHHDFARQALERGWLRLRILELDDRPVAASLGFRFGGVESNYQTGRDPGFSDSSVGLRPPLPLDPRGARGRHARVALPARGRALQGSLRRSRSRARARRAAAEPARAGRARRSRRAPRRQGAHAPKLSGPCTLPRSFSVPSARRPVAPVGLPRYACR